MGVHRSLTTPTHDSGSLIRGRGGSRVAGGTVRRHRPMIMTVKLPRRSERCEVEASTSCHSERSAEARGRPRSGQMRNRDRAGRGLSARTVAWQARFTRSRGAAECIAVEMPNSSAPLPSIHDPRKCLSCCGARSPRQSHPPRAPRLRVTLPFGRGARISSGVRLLVSRGSCFKGSDSLIQGVRLLFEGVRLLDPPDESRSLTP
jgi:hypothetical protein